MSFRNETEIERATGIALTIRNDAVRGLKDAGTDVPKGAQNAEEMVMGAVEIEAKDDVRMQPAHVEIAPRRTPPDRETLLPVAKPYVGLQEIGI